MRYNKKSLKNYLGGIFSYIVYVGYTFIILFPLYWMVLSSVESSGYLFTQPAHYFPIKPTWDHFRNIIQSFPFWTYTTNSIIVTAISTLIAVIFSLLAAYSFTRLRFPGRRFFFLALLFTMMLPAISAVIPLFQMFRSAGLMDTLLGLIIIYSSFLIPFGTWILVSFIHQVPVEIEDSAKIDGCGTLGVIFKVLFPLVKPGIATVIVINLITSWNEFLTPLIFTVSKASKTLTVGLTEYTSPNPQYLIPYGDIQALGLFIIMPLVVLVVIFRKGLVKGLTLGAIKE